MKKKFLKYFIICTAIMLFMSKSSFASSLEIPVWSTNATKLNVTNSSTVNNITNEANQTVNNNQTSNAVNSNATVSPTLNSKEAVQIIH